MATGEDEQGRDGGSQNEGVQKKRARPRKAGAALTHLRPELKTSPAALPDADGIVDDHVGWLDHLQRLREPFPPERIEKLPKPLWKDAWEGRRSEFCGVCHGRHVLENAIHLDYVGHANCTDRLLEVDPCWDWEPLAYTADGLPLFDRVGGLWIKLTVLGVTRIGYGDGKNPKEIIGDAIRNAAMRFGVALDLWAKINLHEERNPGDGPTPQRRDDDRQPVHGQGSGRRPEGGAQGVVREGGAVAPDPAPNQDALDELGSACDQHGYDRRSCGKMFAEWASQQEDPGNPRLIEADSEHIRRFTAYLIDMANADPDAPCHPKPGAADGTAAPVADADPDAPAGDGDRGVGADADKPADGADDNHPDESDVPDGTGGDGVPNPAGEDPF
jgi:hypothetical protein